MNRSLRYLYLGAAVALSLGACANQLEITDGQFGGARVTPTSIDAGYGSVLTVSDPILTKNTAAGATAQALFTVAGNCGRTNLPSLFINLRAKGSANAQANVTGAAPTSPVLTLAGSFGDVVATGGAADYMGLGGGLQAPTPAALDAANHCPSSGTGLPYAPGGTIVDHGMAPPAYPPLPASTPGTPAKPSP